MVLAKLNPRAAEDKLAIIVIMPQRIVVVPRRRLELPRPNGHWHLKPARLPIPPPGHAMSDAQNGRLKHRVRIATNAGVSNLFRVILSTELCWMYRTYSMTCFYIFLQIYFQAKANLRCWDCKEVSHDLV